MTVVTFENYKPVPRYDELPWTDVIIEEAATEDGSYVSIDQVTFDVPDADPAHPQARSFTTEEGTGPNLWYRVIFVDETGDQSLPSSPVQNGTASNLYVSVDDLKTELRITTNDQDTQVEMACEVACRVIDKIKGTRYYPTTETRYYSPGRGDWCVDTEEFTGTATVTVDMVGDGSYSTTWTSGTHFFPEPVNNPLVDEPYRRIAIRRQSGAVFPGYQHALKVTASFGWSATPVIIVKAATMLAARLYSRRDSVYGVLAVGSVDQVAMRLPKTDPDIQALLDNVEGKPARLIA